MTPTLIVTRPTPQGEAFAQAVLAQWDQPLQVVLSPLITIDPVPVLADMSDLKGVIFSSINGVAAAERLDLPTNIPAWCVGQKTGALARQAGFDTSVGAGDVDALAQLIIEQSPNGQIAHIRGRHTRGDMSGRLARAGIGCIDVVAYDQVACALTNSARTILKGKGSVVFPLFSPRTATILGSEGSFSAPTYLVMMSDAVRDAAGNLTAKELIIAARPDEKAMVVATLDVLRALTQGRG